MTISTAARTMLEAEATLTCGEHDEPLPEGYEATITDEQWLAGVAILLADHTDLCVEHAIAIIEDGGVEFLLKARAAGFEAWECAQWIALRLAENEA